jgi:hypothetical protein
MKQHYRADLPRTLTYEDDKRDRIMEKIDGVGCYIWHILGIVFLESSNAGLIMEETSSRSRRR